jgi:ketosteroid isomerase-like protein
MRRALTRAVVDRIYAALGRGDPGPALRAFSARGRLHFPGEHSWAIDTTDAQARRAWFERFAAARPDLRAHDVVVSGWPWRMSVCVVFEDSLRDATGAVAYRNQGVQYLQLRWGRIVLDRLVMDTQRVAAYDVHSSDAAPPE